MKKYSKAELLEKGIEIANENKVDFLFATEDGSHFLPKSENACKNHARENKLKVYELDYSQILETDTKDLVTLNVKETVQLIDVIETLVELEAFSSDERKGVIKAYAERKQILEEAQALAQAAAEKNSEEEE